MKEFQRYHVVKSSRIWRGEPYRYFDGDHSTWLDFHFLSTAREVVKVMADKNPVGWVIIDSQNGKEVE